VHSVAVKTRLKAETRIFTMALSLIYGNRRPVSALADRRNDYRSIDGTTFTTFVHTIADLPGQIRINNYKSSSQFVV
jgi:hypothetical protein